MYSAFQILGSLLILAAFVLTVMSRISQDSYFYLVANAVGSAILGVTAVIRREWGFILLEGVWALVSLGSIIRRMRGHSIQT